MVFFFLNLQKEFALIPNNKALKADVHRVYLATGGNVYKYDFIGPILLP